jgi:hypothetical protein
MRLSLIVAIAAVLANPIMAQETKVEITPLKVEGFVKGNRHVIDAEFAAKNNIAVPAPFEFIAPTSKSHLNYIEPAPGGTGIFRVYFVTPEKQVKSHIQFVPMSVAMGPIEDRLSGLQDLLRNAFIASVPDPAKAEIAVTRRVEIGPYPAIESIGRYDGGDDGVVVLRIVAIPNPESVDGMVAVINGLPKNVKMESVGDIITLDASRALTTFRFK